MSKSYPTVRVLGLQLLLASAVLAGCTESSSKNWNKMFGKSEDRTVEPSRPTSDADASRPKPGVTAAKPETTRNEWQTPTESTNDSSADRGDPGAIEQYASNMNPPASGGPRVAPNSTPSDPPPSFPPERRAAPRGPGESMMGGAPSTSEPSPVRRASDRPVGSSGPGATMFENTNASAPRSTPPPITNDAPRQNNPSRMTYEEPEGTNGRESSDEPVTGAPVLGGVTAKEATPPPTAKTDSPMTRNSESVNAAPANTSASNVETDRRQRDIASQESRVAADPSNVEEIFKLRSMYLFDGDDAKALAPINGIAPDVQEIVLAQLRSMQAARSGSDRAPATWANRQLEAMQALQEKLRAKADLQVPKVALCTEIVQFGVYTPFESNEFQAGVPHDVLIYVEVDNFKSEKTPSDEYRTKLGAKLSLMSEDGNELVSLDEPNIEDFSRGIRRDFFLAFGPITVPGTLPAGKYYVNVQIEDHLGRKTNSNKTELRLVP